MQQVMEQRLLQPLAPVASLLVNVAPKALWIATISVCIPNQTATLVGIAPERNSFRGYHMYMHNACDSFYDLPLYPRLHRASCHDSISFVVSSVEFAQRFTLGTFDKILLDSAHDAEAIYTLISHQKHEPIIDLNKSRKKNIEANGAFQLSPEGVPICPKGRTMDAWFSHRKKEFANFQAMVFPQSA